MFTIPRLLKISRETPVDFHFIKKLAGIGNRLRMVDHETGINQKTTLKKIFGKADCVAVLFHIIHNGVTTPIGHWCLLIKGSKKRPIRFFDSLGLGLRKIYRLTGETPYLLELLKKRKWENSSKKLQTQGKHFKECGCFVGLRAKLPSHQQRVREVYKVCPWQKRQHGSHVGFTNLLRILSQENSNR